jgi:hypothetical protein
LLRRLSARSRNRLRRIDYCDASAMLEQPGHRRGQPLSLLRQSVLGVRGSARDEPPLDYSGVLELLEPLRERGR